MGASSPTAERSRLLEQNLDGVANLALLLGGAEVATIGEDNNTLGALEMGVAPDLFPGQQAPNDKVRSRLAGLWGGRISPLAGLDFDGMLAAAHESTLKAMWVMGADPATDCRVAGEALGRIPFLVVQDLFMTETASIAEVVLPAASFAETDGTFINVTGRLQAIREAKRPPGQAQPDWWIITQAARRMVPSDSKRQKAWDFANIGDVLDEVSKVAPGYHGLSLAAVGSEGWQPPAAPKTTLRAFVRVEAGPPSYDPDYPLILLTGRLLYDRGTLLARAGRVQNLVPGAFVMVHPADAQRLGLADGDDVSVVSAVGRLEFTLKVSDEIVPGVAFAPQNLSAAPLSVLFPDRWTLPHVRIAK
jgi:predicted molibdopterin-dependent oxidoreductase YjgC